LINYFCDIKSTRYFMTLNYRKDEKEHSYESEIKNKSLFKNYSLYKSN
jgi:hypothetical protein